MARYKVQLTKRIMRDYDIEVPDDIPSEDVKEWVSENISDVWDVEDWHKAESWKVDDLEEGKDVTVVVNCESDLDEYDIDGFSKQ